MDATATVRPVTCALRLQDSSSGNTSDGDSQDGRGQTKGKAKERTGTPAKDATPRPGQQKATPGYKVEDKSP